MTNTIDGTHFYSSQSNFQQIMGQQNAQQQQVEPWMQTPQVPPITIPWSVSEAHQTEVIRFTGETSSGPIVHQKRKLDMPDLIDTHQTKQFITEEKMAAHFKSLRISSTSESENSMSSSTDHTLSFSYKQSDMDLDVDATNAVNTSQKGDIHPRLVLSEELKRMQQEPILPSTLLSKLVSTKYRPLCEV
ncbi:uncharacterized protein LOC109861567 isoform X1 [Pseudomyrmex gracilis]|uniref:uncharacterized protein LOC109861567 isoform X1 n=1 Tax=Pseudomyrmex gracilis TaxID=219809 RepID=UPI000994A513|nr:uncharacterized protein LOC109861567 isoform X1 [Pseudomyrmex gracilis]